MRPGRRAFFLPRLLSGGSWPTFCHRLARVVRGSLEDETPAGGGPGRARLQIARDEDAYHARALCAEFGVLLLQAGASETRLPTDRHWLWLDASRLNGIDSFDAEQGRMALQIACPVAKLRERLSGSGWCWPGGSDEQTVGQWLASAGGWLPGRCEDSGLESADVLLADGTFEQLGPFGVDSTQALRTAASGRLISDLFQLSTERGAAAMMVEAAWPARYRLDALMPVAQAGQVVPPPNPAHFLLGSEGSLAWPSRIRVRLRRVDEPPPPVLKAPPQPESGRETPADALDGRIKALFDAIGVFPSLVV